MTVTGGANAYPSAQVVSFFQRAQEQGKLQTSDMGAVQAATQNGEVDFGALERQSQDNPRLQAVLRAFIDTQDKLNMSGASTQSHPMEGNSFTFTPARTTGSAVDSPAASAPDSTTQTTEQTTQLPFSRAQIATLRQDAYALGNRLRTQASPSPAQQQRLETKQNEVLQAERQNEAQVSASFEARIAPVTAQISALESQIASLDARLQQPGNPADQQLLRAQRQSLTTELTVSRQQLGRLQRDQTERTYGSLMTATSFENPASWRNLTGTGPLDRLKKNLALEAPAVADLYRHAGQPNAREVMSRQSLQTNVGQNHVYSRLLSVPFDDLRLLSQSLQTVKTGQTPQFTDLDQSRLNRMGLEIKDGKVFNNLTRQEISGESLDRLTETTDLILQGATQATTPEERAVGQMRNTIASGLPFPARVPVQSSGAPGSREAVSENAQANITDIELMSEAIAQESTGIDEMVAEARTIRDDLAAANSRLGSVRLVFELVGMRPVFNGGSVIRPEGTPTRSGLALTAGQTNFTVPRTGPQGSSRPAFMAGSPSVSFSSGLISGQSGQSGSATVETGPAPAPPPPGGSNESTPPATVDGAHANGPAPEEDGSSVDDAPILPTMNPDVSPEQADDLANGVRTATESEFASFQASARSYGFEVSRDADNNLSYSRAGDNGAALTGQTFWQEYLTQVNGDLNTQQHGSQKLQEIDNRISQSDQRLEEMIQEASRLKASAQGNQTQMSGMLQNARQELATLKAQLAESGSRLTPEERKSHEDRIAKAEKEIQLLESDNAKINTQATQTYSRLDESQSRAQSSRRNGKTTISENMDMRRTLRVGKLRGLMNAIQNIARNVHAIPDTMKKSVNQADTELQATVAANVARLVTEANELESKLTLAAAPEYEGVDELAEGIQDILRQTEMIFNGFARTETSTQDFSTRLDSEYIGKVRENTDYHARKLSERREESRAETAARAADALRHLRSSLFVAQSVTASGN